MRVGINSKGIHRLYFALAALGSLGLFFFGLKAAWNAYLIKVMDVKSVREATAVALSKGLIRFDEKNHASQTDRGDPIERPVGFEEWRVYYKIVDFHGFDEKT